VSVRQHLTCRGFTLIELLVVISIIALLIGILVPALSSARGAARRIKCQTQVRSIGTGVANYSLSYKDLVPHMSDLRSTSLNTVGTGQFYVWYGDKNGAIGALLDNEYVQWDSLDCTDPADLDGIPFNTHFADGGISVIGRNGHHQHDKYVYNSYHFPLTAFGTNSPTVNKWDPLYNYSLNSGDIPFVTEMNFFQGHLADPSAISLPHNNLGFSVGYIDNSVKWYQTEIIDASTAPTSVDDDFWKTVYEN
tara:strand:- start:2343 stop:3092 length:750 start_codon:yes stop_codon:yes gene_type:complete